MATNPCSIKVDCDCVANDFPISNYSSEAAEQSGVYTSVAFPAGLYDSAGCLSVCTSSISQMDADLCAQAQQAQCENANATDTGTTGGGGGGGTGDGGITDVSKKYFNNAKSCKATCPDGTSLTIVVQAGTISAATQAAADALAYTRACQYANLYLTCLSDIDPPTCCVGSEWNGFIYATGMSLGEPYYWSIATGTGTPPPGLALQLIPRGRGSWENFSASNTVSIYPYARFGGTPTAIGTYTCSVLFECGPVSITKPYTISVHNMIPDVLPNYEVGVPYDQTLLILPEVTPAPTWSIPDIYKQLPPGLTLDSETGIISGTPTVAGDYPVTIRAASTSFDCSKSYLLTTGTAPPEWCCNVYNEYQIIADDLEYVDSANWWELISGELPPGLNLEYKDAYGPLTNWFSGTPTTAGEYSFTLKVTTSAGTSQTIVITICVICITCDPAGDDPSKLPDGTQGDAYSATMQVDACAHAPLNWQVTAGALPAGLTLDEETGEISGTPTESGTFTFTVTLQTEAS